MNKDEEENKEELTPEEKRIHEEFTKAVHEKGKAFLEKVFAPLNWCWPATLVILLVRWILNSVGHYELSLWAATVFLWGPGVLLVGAVTLFVSFIYIVSLFGAWHKFLQNMVFYFKLGFGNGAGKKNEEKEDEDDETL